MMCFTGLSAPAPVILASPVAQPPSGRHASSSSGPAARWIAPSTPPPPSSEVFAALTIASTRSRVMSPSAASITRRGIAIPPCARRLERGTSQHCNYIGATSWTERGIPMDRVIFLGADGERSWQDQANCMGVDPDLFFPERGASTREAKEVCRGCVVREDCLEYALANGEKFGIWGGMSERERRRIRRARALARKANGVASA